MRELFVQSLQSQTKTFGTSMKTFWDRLYAQIVFFPTLWWNMLLGRVIGIRQWWNLVDENVILGAYPFPNDVRQLDQLGVGAVVNTCEEYEGPIKEYDYFKIDQCRIPTTDFTHPSLEDVETAVAFMEAKIAEGSKVYVHCKAGRARSATIVACYFIKAKNLTAITAQQIMQKHRPHINPKIYERPVVRAFENKYLRNKASTT
ncbi:MAG: dual specificity protein phosphatase family protein [Planctomycetota bacterium]